MRYVYGIAGGIAATIDSSGIVTLGSEPGPPLGCVRGDTDVYADEVGAERLGGVDQDGRVRDAQFQIIGTVDASGRVIDTSSRVVGRVDRPVDAAVLLLLIAPNHPEAIAPPEPSSDDQATIMEETLSLAEEQSRPGIRKNYRKLTDADVYGKAPPPPRKD